MAPYNGGAELAGCGGGEAAFAKKPAVELDRVQVKICFHTSACPEHTATHMMLLHTRSEAVHLAHTDEPARCTGVCHHPW